MQQFDDSGTMTGAELADLLCISTKTLANWRCQGKGPPFLKFGRSVRYRKSSVDTWLAANEVASTSALSLRPRKHAADDLNKT